MLGVVLAENEVHELALIVDDGQRVELVIPNDIVCFFKRGVLGSGDELGKRGHELTDLGRDIHAADTVVTAGNDT